MSAYVLGSLNFPYSVLPVSIWQIGGTIPLTKRPDRLESLLYTYASFHNLWAERKTSREKPRLVWKFVIN